MNQLTKDQRLELIRKARSLWAKQIMDEDMRLKRSDIVENSSLSKMQKEQIHNALLRKIQWNKELIGLYVQAILNYGDKRRQERRQIAAMDYEGKDWTAVTAK